MKRFAIILSAVAVLAVSSSAFADHQSRRRPACPTQRYSNYYHPYSQYRSVPSYSYRYNNNFGYSPYNRYPSRYPGYYPSSRSGIQYYGNGVTIRFGF